MIMKNSALTCARYAFRPNKLKYCGPEKNQELFEYLKAQEDDGGLKNILENFECLYPYLNYIGGRNKTSDCFNTEVSKAYWVGNDFLNNTGGAKLYGYLEDNFAINKKNTREEIDNLSSKIVLGANAHHSFHVFNVWQSPKQAENPHVLYIMDECRVGWGEVREILGEIIKVLYEPVVFAGGRLSFGAPVVKDIFYELRNAPVKKGDWISFHWSSFCEVLSPEDLKNLIYWTSINLKLANYVKK